MRTIRGNMAGLIIAWATATPVLSAPPEPRTSPMNAAIDGNAAGDRPSPSSIADSGDVRPEDSPVAEADATPLPAKPGWPIPTLGGRQFWGDVQYFHNYRIQQNVFTKHYRLLDAYDRRLAGGTLEECQQVLATVRTERKLPEMTGPCVVLIHGIVRSSKSMSALSNAAKAAGYTPFDFDYPSTQADIATCAEYLHETLSRLEGVTEINFIVHSMGGLVVRSYLARHGDPRIKRMVMLGTPNNGAGMADLLHKNFAFRAILGPAGQQLVTTAAGGIPALPIPNFEFAIIAGGRGDDHGWNPLIPGDDDGTVEVTSTRLPGAADFLVLPSLHTFMIRDKNVVTHAIRFLRTGALRENGQREPIPVIVVPDAIDAPSTE